MRVYTYSGECIHGCVRLSLLLDCASNLLGKPPGKLNNGCGELVGKLAAFFVFIHRLRDYADEPE